MLKIFVFWSKYFEISKFLFRFEIWTSKLVCFWSTIVCSDVFDDIRQFYVIEQKRKIIFFAEINTLFSNYWIIKQVFEIQWYFRFSTTVWLSYLQFVRVYTFTANRFSAVNRLKCLRMLYLNPDVKYQKTQEHFTHAKIWINDPIVAIQNVCKVTLPSNEQKLQLFRL